MIVLGWLNVGVVVVFDVVLVVIVFVIILVLGG